MLAHDEQKLRRLDAEFNELRERHSAAGVPLAEENNRAALAEAEIADTERRIEWARRRCRWETDRASFSAAEATEHQAVDRVQNDTTALRGEVEALRMSLDVQVRGDLTLVQHRLKMSQLEASAVLGKLQARVRDAEDEVLQSRDDRDKWRGRFKDLTSTNEVRSLRNRVRQLHLVKLRLDDITIHR